MATGLQLGLLRLIDGVAKTTGYPPTLRELTDMWQDVSLTTMARWVRSLVNDELLEGRPGKSRCRRLTARGRALLIRYELGESAKVAA